MRMKIAHEAPNQIFDLVQGLTDYDYCLVHLLQESEEYRDNFLRAKKKGREILLDNSVFELGESFDAKEYLAWIRKLEPEWFIIPDVLRDARATVILSEMWVNTPTGKSKKIAVIQGTTREELFDCYLSFSVKGIDKIAIPFNFEYYEEISGYNKGLLRSREHGWMIGRQMFIEDLIKQPFFNPKTPLHLLGASLPQEYLAYRNYSFIDSMDSSNPVVHGLKNITYNPVHGLQDKVSTKLFTLIDSDVNFKQIECIKFNIEVFKSFCE